MSVLHQGPALRCGCRSQGPTARHGRSVGSCTGTWVLCQGPVLGHGSCDRVLCWDMGAVQGPTPGCGCCARSHAGAWMLCQDPALESGSHWDVGAVQVPEGQHAGLQAGPCGQAGMQDAQPRLGLALGGVPVPCPPIGHQRPHPGEAALGPFPYLVTAASKPQSPREGKYSPWRENGALGLGVSPGFPCPRT